MDLKCELVKHTYQNVVERAACILSRITRRWTSRLEFFLFTGGDLSTFGGSMALVKRETQ